MTIIDKRAAEWLASDDTGSSSKAILLWMGAEIAEKAFGPATPSDPADLGRCLRLLDRFPEWRARFSEMANAGGLWPTFARRWSEIEATFLAECGGDLPGPHDHRQCPKTYALMKEVHAEAYAADRPGFVEINLGPGISMRMGRK